MIFVYIISDLIRFVNINICMNTSPNGIKLIQQSEGFVNHCYPDAGGFSIGFGTHLDTPELLSQYKNEIVTVEQATILMQPKITLSEKTINQYVTVTLTQNQFDALVDFTYNLGSGALISSTLLTLLNKGLFEEAANEFPKWNHSGGKVIPGLTRRRETEKLLFLS
jgi:lysozyme